MLFIRFDMDKYLEKKLRHLIILQEQIKAVQSKMADKEITADSGRSALQDELNLLLREKECSLELQPYLELKSGLPLCTKNRLDYEEILARLSPEQEKIVGDLTSGRDYLLRGAAGTGKSLVLLGAMYKALLQGRLDFYLENPIIFMTYTKTLVKYSRFTAGLMKMEIPPVLFSTADDFIFENLKRLEPEVSCDFNIIKTFLSITSGFSFISRQELAAELDEFLLGRLVSRKEYITRNIRREGMVHPLNREQRIAVWKMRNEYIEYMRKQGRYSVNYVRCRLVELMQDEKKNDLPKKGLQTVFIDEVQDLNPAALAAVKSLTIGSLVMAGDFQQSLYMTQTPFIRAGIDIRGTTRILKVNLRNTRQILEAAAAFQKRGGQDGWPSIASFREGPPVELFQEEDTGRLKNSLLKRIEYFLNDQGYVPENVCILAPDAKELEEWESLLSENNLKNIRVNDDDFDFTLRGQINLSTLQDCKGLDFPVVLLYLPELKAQGRYSPDRAERLQRNLIYTAMTRAMDHLNLFVRDGHDKILASVISAVE